jgi:hypothetical protein
VVPLLLQGNRRADLLWGMPTSPLNDLSIAEAAAIGEGMVASEVSQAATASTATARSITKSAAK